MKKSLIALAVLAAAGAASAQSSVTLFGVVDAAISVGRGGATDRTRMVSGAYNSSRLGFRGTEDLGGGMSASFWLEASLNNDDGGSFPTNTNNQVSGATTGNSFNFGRRSTVSLAGGFGEVRLGRDYTPQFWNHTVFDPFGSVGTGASQSTLGKYALNAQGGGVFGTGVRASNSIGYFLPGNLGGLYGQVMYHLGENVQDGGTVAERNIRDNGKGYGLRLGYAAGPINVAAATSRIEFRDAGGGFRTDVRENNIGGQLDLGVAKLMGFVNREKAGLIEGKGFTFGGLFPIGSGEIRAAYSQYETEAIGPDPRTRKIAVGYVHNLSKRTALYTTYARVKNNGFAITAPSVALNASTGLGNASSSGFDFGVRHSF